MGNDEKRTVDIGTGGPVNDLAIDEEQVRRAVEKFAAEYKDGDHVPKEFWHSCLFLELQAMMRGEEEGRKALENICLCGHPEFFHRPNEMHLLVPAVYNESKNGICSKRSCSCWIFRPRDLK